MNKTAWSGMLCVAVWMATMAGAPAASNTVVRFTITHGTIFVGNVDVELFDSEKPITVSNFLNYVRSGAYINNLIHRASPDSAPVIVQGGGFTLPNPYSFEEWTCYPLVPTNAPITNEFHVGPLRSNIAGTLAMAKISGDPNSASSGWFFNIADNSANLDTNNGGFTVFGRVIRGLPVLINNFKTARPYYGLIGELPVSFRPSLRYPRPAELFLVQILELSAGDVLRPTLAITSPPLNHRFSNDMLTVTGTARDNRAVHEIWCYPDSCTRVVAEGTENWTWTQTNAPPGTNLIVAESVDAAGNRSLIAKRSYFRVVPWALDLQKIGEGKIIGATNGQILEIGRNFVVTAIPAPGHTFVEWEAKLLGDTNTGSRTVSSPRVTAFMQSNLSLTAKIVLNPFPPLRATYSGLFLNTNDIFFIHPNFGVITLSVTDQGRVTGKLQMQGRSFPFSGSLPTTGFANIPVARPGLPSLIVEMTLDVTNRSEIIKGFVYDSRERPLGWSSPFEAVRVRPGTLGNPSPFAGSYTVLLPGAATAPNLIPTGDGFGRVTVSPAGNLIFVGTLADGSPVTQGVPLTTNGVWPFYSSLYAGKGSVVAPVKFDFSRPGDDLSGDALGWFRAPQTRTPLFTNGFSFYGDIIGSRYHVPSNLTVRMLDFTNGIATFMNGNLSEPLTNTVELRANNVVIPYGLNGLTSLYLTRASGLFSGTLKPTNSSKVIPFKGAVLQKQNFGAGFFLGTNQCGRVYFGP